jgi:hypothetical protein
MNEIDHFNFFILCNDYVVADVDHLYVKRIYLVSFSYIVIEDKVNQSKQGSVFSLIKGQRFSQDNSSTGKAKVRHNWAMRIT